jgi:hypothetical protein
MKSQGVRCEIESGCNSAGGHALGTGFDKQAKHVKAVILSERSQCRDDIRLFHISMNIEMNRWRQVLFQRLLKCS